MTNLFFKLYFEKTKEGIKTYCSCFGISPDELITCYLKTLEEFKIHNLKNPNNPQIKSFEKNFTDNICIIEYESSQ